MPLKPMFFALGVLVVVACGDDSDTAETNGVTGSTAPTTSTAPATSGTTAAMDTASGDETAAATGADCVDDAPQLRIVNTTGNAIAEIQMIACDMSEEVAFPVPPDALPTDAELTIDLPGPGCWVVTYSGEGCFPDPSFMADAAACELVTWEAGPDTHVCAGG